MRYLALYRKYRPSNFEEVVGQEKVVNVIKNEILNDRISHAYLFSGPRGTGKTTTAKIIAKLVNCTNLENGEPCNKCDSCLNFKNNTDIIEIDAASNNGVDEIRGLRDTVNYAPSSSKYKVYIIDEVHMLTIPAFNALLKTLEEPPSHVIFILATTELHKIPATVASRCQKFQFSKISNEEIVKRLKTIVLSENIELNDDILYEIARLSDGGLRDAINMLDQLIAYKEKDITLLDVYKINGSVSYVDLYDFVMNMKNNKVVELINFIESIDKEGKNISKFVTELIVFFKDILLYKNAGIKCDIEDKNNKIIELSKILEDKVIYNMIYTYNDTLNNMKISSNSLILFVIGTLKIINENFGCVDIKKENFVDSNNRVIDVVEKKDKVNNNKSKEIDDEVRDIKEVVEENKAIKEESKKEILSKDVVDIRINNTFALANKNDLNDIKQRWSLINEYLLDDNIGVNCGLLKDTDVVAAGDKYLILTSNFDYIVDKVNSKLDELEKNLNDIFGKKYCIIALTVENWNNEKEKYRINKNKGIKYSIKEEIKNEQLKEKSPVDMLIDTIGVDLVEIDKER